MSIHEVATHLGGGGELDWSAFLPTMALMPSTIEVVAYECNDGIKTEVSCEHVGIKG